MWFPLELLILFRRRSPSLDTPLAVEFFRILLEINLLREPPQSDLSKSLTELRNPDLHRFRRMLQLSAFPLLRAAWLQAPHMLLICPIDAYECSELRFLLT